MKIVDNFLDTKNFEQIKNIVFSQDFPWTYNEYCIDPPAPQVSQFTHVFFWNNIARETYPIIMPLIDKLNPKSIGKIKANLNLKTEKIIETGVHTDTVDERFTSAVYFLNDNNGYCKINNEKIYSKANSIVMFKSNTPHTGSTCTDKNRRVLLNFVYIN
tara:strand:- start:1034 stop:1510 length:477 start_codon:yes stop_codon:yes gene_type:complete